jgi:hypothetical protein
MEVRDVVHRAFNRFRRIVGTEQKLCWRNECRQCGPCEFVSRVSAVVVQLPKFGPQSVRDVLVLVCGVLRPEGS